MFDACGRPFQAGGLRQSRLMSCVESSSFFFFPPLLGSSLEHFRVTITGFGLVQLLPGIGPFVNVRNSEGYSGLGKKLSGSRRVVLCVGQSCPRRNRFLSSLLN